MDKKLPEELRAESEELAGLVADWAQRVGASAPDLLSHLLSTAAYWWAWIERAKTEADLLAGDTAPKQLRRRRTERRQLANQTWLARLKETHEAMDEHVDPVIRRNLGLPPEDS